MPRIPFRKKVEEFIERKNTQEDWADTTLRHYQIELGRMQEFFQGRKPSALSTEDIREYTDQRYDSLKPKTIESYWAIQKNFLQWCGNTDIHRVNVKPGDVKDREVYWLTETQSSKVRQTVREMEGMYRILFHLGRDLGLRRCEMKRLKWKDISFPLESINVHGKYDKWRMLYFTPITKEVLEDWKKEREKMLEKAREYDPDVEIKTDHVLMWQRYGEVGNPEDTTMDSRLEKIEEKSGVEMHGFHTLRRTFARFKYNNGVDIKTLRDLLGHESVEVTERYIGIQQDKKREACQMPVQKAQTHV